MGSNPAPKPPLLTLRVVVLLLTSVLVSVGTGVLTHLSGQPTATAVLAGAGAFAATLVGLHEIVD